MYSVKIKRDKAEDREVTIPQYKTKASSGMDVHAWKYEEIDSVIAGRNETFRIPEEGYVLNPHERVLIHTGLRMELPQNTEIQARPRSGLALKYGITLTNSPGTIDEDYRGDIGLIVANTSNKPYVIFDNDRLGQIVLVNVLKMFFVESEELCDTERGEGGYGSTGK